MSLEYTRGDGTVESAASLTEAYKHCPFLGKMSLEQAAVFVEIYERGEAILEQYEDKLSVEPAPKVTALDAVEHNKPSGKVETATMPLRQNNLDVELARADRLFNQSSTGEKERLLKAKSVIEQPIIVLQPEFSKTRHLDSKPRSAIDTSLPKPTHISEKIVASAERSEPAIIEVFSLPITKPDVDVPGTETAVIEVPQLAQAIDDEIEVQPISQLEISDTVSEIAVDNESEPEVINLGLNQINYDDTPEDPDYAPLTINEEANGVDVEIAEITLALNSALAELETVEKVVVYESIEKIVALLVPSEPESETQVPIVFEQLLVEEADELNHLVETLCALIGYETPGKELDLKIFIEALSQVFPALKPVILEADLEREGTKEAKRQYQWGKIKGSDLGGTIARVSQIIGMLVLLRGSAILPVDF